MQCRDACGACCIAPSISSPLPGLPDGKPAGMVCPHLDARWRCQLFGQPQRPAVCAAFQAEEIICGQSREQAMATLEWLEQASA